MLVLAKRSGKGQTDSKLSKNLKALLHVCHQQEQGPGNLEIRQQPRCFLRYSAF